MTFPIALLIALSIWGCKGRVGEPVQGHALLVVLPRDAEQIDPRFVSDPYGLKVSRLIFASLLTIDPDTLEVIPDLAERVDVLSPRHYRAHLRPGLRFSDGSVLDATDVVETFRGVVDPTLASRYAGSFRRIKEVKAIDPLTVEFFLNEDHATFLTDLEFPILRTTDARKALNTEHEPIGAGPYRLIDRAMGRLELAPNPYWHRGSPIRPRLRFVVVRDDNTRALRMLAGKGDIALNAIPPRLIPLFEQDERFRVKSAPGISTMYIGFNTEAKHLRDPIVRQAIAHAIDRESIIKAKYGGRARLADGWIPPAHWAYVKHSVPGYDPGRAKWLLDQAGLKDPDGEGGEPRLKMTLRTGADRFRVSVSRAIAAMLSEVGIEVDVRPSETATLIADLNRGRFQMTILQVPEVMEPHVLSWFFASDRIPGGGNEGANRWRFRSAELDALFEIGRKTTDREGRKAAYAGVQRILAKGLPVFPLWHPDVVGISRAGISYKVPRDGRFGTLAF